MKTQSFKKPENRILERDVNISLDDELKLLTEANDDGWELVARATIGATVRYYFRYVFGDPPPDPG